MKPIFLTVLLVCVSLTARADDPGRIRAFYEAYMRNMLDGKDARNRELCGQYMTRSLIRKMARASAATNFDNIIRGQDMNETAIRTLTVTPLGDDRYSVCYLWYADDPASKIEIRVKAAGDPCRIVDIGPAGEPQPANKQN